MTEFKFAVALQASDHKLPMLHIFNMYESQHWVRMLCGRMPIRENFRTSKLENTGEFLFDIGDIRPHFLYCKRCHEIQRLIQNSAWKDPDRLPATEEIYHLQASDYFREIECPTCHLIMQTYGVNEAGDTLFTCEYCWFQKTIRVVNHRNMTIPQSLVNAR